MPQHQQTIALPQYNASQLIALSYATFQHLGWGTELAFEDRLVGFTKKTWNRHHDHILVDAADNTLTVTSKLPEGSSWDLLQKNKKNVRNFLSSFETVAASATESLVQEWEASVASLREQTNTTLEKEAQEAAEVEEVMNLSAGSKTVTYALIGANILLFVAMVASGVHFFAPQTADLLAWGANYMPLTTGGEWWRLLTATFIHIGIIHLLFNMYALYMAGIYLEPMLGKGRYLAAYLCTGVLASVCSTWWHGAATVSAGASGAIFGLYGVFLALLSTKLIPQTVRKALLQSIGVFVVYNLVYGAGAKGIDNAAHLGGMISGLVLGYLYFFSLRKPSFRPPMAIGLTVVATVLLSFSYLKTSNNDAGVYAQKVDEVLAIQEKAIAPLQNYTSDDDLLTKLSTVSQVEWAKAKAILDETKAYKLDDNLSKHRKLLQDYIALRIRHTDLAIVALQGKEDVAAELDNLANQINENLVQLNAK
ncbi:rhomboid family intramembrane serine protease [Flavisolibacter sp. BT320]|nr:rhomboid family intramembrane serine protease [Flavisolibacter longurius]